MVDGPLASSSPPVLSEGAPRAAPRFAGPIVRYPARALFLWYAGLIVIGLTPERGRVWLRGRRGKVSAARASNDVKTR